jgi:hypothetical protein
VTAGVGNGNMMAAALDAVRRAIAKGVVVVLSTRVPVGSVGRNVEVNDDEVGTVASGELNPAKARVLLKLALLKTRDPAKIQALFDRYWVAAPCASTPSARTTLHTGTRWKVITSPLDTQQGRAYSATLREAGRDQT